MNNIIVYCETDGGRLCDVSLELMTKARDLAASLSCDVEALLIGHDVRGLADELYSYGAAVVHLADDKRLEFFRTLPYASITIDLFRKEQPQIALFGATSVGRDLAPRVSSALHSGLTADCTSLEIGDHQDKENTTSCTRSAPHSEATSSPPSSIPSTGPRWPLSARV